MKNTLIADTGYFAALANPKDAYYQHAIRFSKTLQADLLTTWPVLTETCHYLIKRVSPLAQSLLLRQVANGTISVFEFGSDDALRMAELMEKYADLPMDLADASLVILAEQLGHGRILSTDQRDFNAYRWKNHQPFQNLLLPEH
ncbi:MAG: VapC toxin family PIN domain ribonuclease [Methylobacter sp.]|nr:MAG: VapC toxin family PIN domain ribonuclease [Methylobacter sp.]